MPYRPEDVIHLCKFFSENKKAVILIFFVNYSQRKYFKGTVQRWDFRRDNE
jgi:hypothetical protein